MERARNESPGNERRGTTASEIWDAVREGEAPSLASIWRCPACGAQIQIVVAPTGMPSQPFTCVDGTPMVAGDSH